MILKRKKNCKLIFINQKYYIYTDKILYHFGENYNEAMRYYENIREIEKEGVNRYYYKGKFHLELYVEEIENLIKSLECYKFFISNNIFLDCNKEKLKEKSYDIEFLAQHIYSLYVEYIKAKNREKGED